MADNKGNGNIGGFPVPPEYQGLVGAARDYQLRMDVQQRAADDPDRLDRENMQRTMELGRWAVGIMVEAGIRPDYRDEMVTRETRQRGILFKRSVTEEVRTPVEGWILHREEGGEAGTGSYWEGGTVLTKQVGLGFWHSNAPFRPYDFYGIRNTQYGGHDMTKVRIMALLVRHGLVGR